MHRAGANNNEFAANRWVLQPTGGGGGSPFAAGEPPLAAPAPR
jgi:hypothetical protein